MQPSASMLTFDSASSFEDVRGYSTPTSSDPSGAASPVRGLGGGRYRSKMCRHYLMGVVCPFEDRCAFAHGEDEISAAPPAVSNAAMRRASCAFEATVPPPPSYGLFIHEAVASMPFSAFSNSPVESAPITPVGGLRYRFDPYGMDNVVFQ